jgi:hypothetical protein
MNATIALGYFRADLSNELFIDALNTGQKRKFWASLTHRQTNILDLAEYKIYMKNGSFKAQRDVEIDDIRGSESRQKDFDDKFYPLTNRTRQRWQSIARASEQGMNLPPVELIQVGKIYFVRDGHHRISVARALGWKTISAHVTVWND